MAGDLELENLEEFIIDEDKIVSYKWLSKTLSLHVNQAKKILEKFVKEWRKKPNAEVIHVTYLISGTQETHSGNLLTKVVIAEEDRLEDVKKKFKEVLGQHVYSVQKSHLKDSNVLYTTDFDQIKNNLAATNRFSAITCKDATPRSREDLQRLRAQSQMTQDSSSLMKPSSSKISSTQKLTNGHASNTQTSHHATKKKGLDAFMNKPKKESGISEKKEEAKTDSKPSIASTKQKKGGLFTFASKMISKAPSDEKSSNQIIEKKSSKLDADKNTTKPTAEDESSKLADKDKSSRSSSESKSSKSTSVDKSSMLETEEKSSSKSRLTDEETETADSRRKEAKKEKTEIKGKRDAEFESKSKSSEKKSTGDKRKARNISDSDSEGEDENRKKDSKGKKRRRVIQEVSSSSEESEDEEADMDDSPIPPTPEPQKTAEEPEKPVDTGTKRKGRKSKRVMRKKTYIDDDGCMVTENVWEYESTDASDDDESSPTKKPTPTIQKEDTPKKKGPSPGRKQMALTSFFKKK